MDMWSFIVVVIACLTDLSICCKTRYGYGNIYNCARCGDWKCLECRPGYYGNYCYECRSSCYTCTAYNVCTSCKNGFYGRYCNTQCPNNCKYKKCDKLSGLCSEGCKNGYYKDTGGECRECPGGCSRCISASQCTECKSGLYRERCDNRCPYRYFYRDGQCVPCQQQCSACSSETNCSVCDSGYFGNVCEVCSELCLNGCRQADGECIRCIDGYYKNGNECRRCADGCAKCESDKMCEQCSDGYFLVTNMLPFTKHCYVCSKNCSKCTGNNSCIECSYGYANVDGACVSCLNCENPTSCSDSSQCSQCLDGFWGPYCRSRCNESCTECDKSTGVCTGCRDDRFGQFCELECSRNCLKSSDNTSSCFQHNGTCVEGCNDRSTGEDCLEAVSTKSTSSSGSHLTTGVVVGTVGILVIIVAVTLIYRKQAIQCCGTKSTQNIPRDTAGSRERNKTPSDVITDSAEAVYAVVQKKRHRKLRYNDIKNNEGVYDTASSRPGQVPDVRMSISLVDGNTERYSRVNHAIAKTSQNYGDDENEYDQVVRLCNVAQINDDGNTYDVAVKQRFSDAGSVNSHDDKYDQVFHKNLQNCNDDNTYDVAVKQHSDDTGNVYCNISDVK